MRTHTSHLLREISEASRSHVHRTSKAMLVAHNLSALLVRSVGSVTYRCDLQKLYKTRNPCLFVGVCSCGWPPTLVTIGLQPFGRNQHQNRGAEGRILCLG